jgi:hypothetical protein
LKGCAALRHARRTRRGRRRDRIAIVIDGDVAQAVSRSVPSALGDFSLQLH